MPAEDGQAGDGQPRCDIEDVLRRFVGLAVFRYGEAMVRKRASAKPCDGSEVSGHRAKDDLVSRIHCFVGLHGR